MFLPFRCLYQITFFSPYFTLAKVAYLMLFKIFSQVCPQIHPPASYADTAYPKAIFFQLSS